MIDPDGLKRYTECSFQVNYQMVQTHFTKLQKFEVEPHVKIHYRSPNPAGLVLLTGLNFKQSPDIDVWCSQANDDDVEFN